MKIIFQSEQNGNIMSWSPTKSCPQTPASPQDFTAYNTRLVQNIEEPKKTPSPLHSFSTLIDRISPEKRVDPNQKGVS